ncbi:hypothetical protein NBE99_06765 [Thermosynechococcus sp. HN-54]|uniref:TOPRIM nucleotidyl transferase/hydrolase domain-containing protein n=1 Tax=Thermosynechococcus sp. HN-54 TaxID=2933959 RepID=UPI00202CF09B|nr:TOPRIM nucleotidyl transferase/hydrolase domain-containing protein [Thermosynechococcus sp. HN-54]URR34356.1 hypothetical protein NBE99_06765 [Thermosynechococcus sp. HN-54]
MQNTGTQEYTKFHGGGRSAQRRLGKIIYIPAFSKLDDQTKLTGSSPLRDLIHSFMMPALENGKAYQHLKRAFKAFEENLRDEAHTSISRLEKLISDKIYHWGAKAEIIRWQQAGIRVHEDDQRIEMESIKYTLWLNSNRCSAFFYNRVLLVEAATQVALVALFEYMTSEAGLLDSGQFFVFDCMGKYNIHRFMNLFGELGICHAVLCDTDNECVSKTIENSKNNYTLGIDYIQKDIESFLGISIKSSESHRKPQN